MLRPAVSSHYRNITLSAKDSAVLYLCMFLYTYVTNITVYIGPVLYIILICGMTNVQLTMIFLIMYRV